MRKVLSKLDALDNRLAEIEAVQRGLLEHVLTVRHQRQLSDAKTGLRGRKEDRAPATAAADDDDDDTVEIVGFVPQRRSRLTTTMLHIPVKTEKKRR